MSVGDGVPLARRRAENGLPRRCAPRNDSASRRRSAVGEDDSVRPVCRRKTGNKRKRLSNGRALPCKHGNTRSTSVLRVFVSGKRGEYPTGGVHIE